MLACIYILSSGQLFAAIIIMFHDYNIICNINSYHFEIVKKLTTCNSFKEKSTKMGYMNENLKLIF